MQQLRLPGFPVRTKPDPDGPKGKDGFIALDHQQAPFFHVTPKWIRRPREWYSSGHSIYHKFGTIMAAHDLLRPLYAEKTDLSDPTEIRLTHGGALEVLKGVPDNTYDAVVTSPPYYFIRDYQVKGQIGLEPTRKQHIDALAKVFEEVLRVLKPTGTMWLNVGDSYCTRRAIRDDGKRSVATGKKLRSWADSAKADRVIRGGQQFGAEGIREKSLFNIPHMLVEACMQAGWVYRSEIVWFKTHAVPEKARDAPLSATESVFLMSKEQSGYVYNGEVLREKGSTSDPAGRPHRNLWEIGPSRYKSDHVATMPEELAARCILTGTNKGGLVLDPFGGAGTTGVAARMFGRSAHLIDLNQDYLKIARSRVDSISIVAGTDSKAQWPEDMQGDAEVADEAEPVELTEAQKLRLELDERDRLIAKCLAEIDEHKQSILDLIDELRACQKKSA